MNDEYLALGERRRRASAAQTAVARPCVLQFFRALPRRFPNVLFLVLVLIGSARIVATYTVFSHTIDEPAHIACGMQWLADGVYQWEAQHPPLARIAAAIGPFVFGIRSQGTPKINIVSMWDEGLEILYSGNHYERTLALARLGVLPFFWVACVVVYLWGSRYWGTPTALLAVLLFSFLPPVLAQAGQATTDMACTAFLGAAFLSGCVLLEKPSLYHALVFGLCVGLAVLSKFSVLVFLPVSAVTALACYAACAWSGLRWTVRAVKVMLPLLVLSTVVACLAIWAAYRFSYGPDPWAGYRFSFSCPIPAPEFWAGIREVWRHNAYGDRAYALGQIGDRGLWYFFPVALAVKTPIAFLIAVAAGIVFVICKPSNWRVWLPVAFSAPILVVGMCSRISIGLRHILPIYMGLSLLGALALARLWNRWPRPLWPRITVSALVLWMTAASLLSHPDYLAYFNEIASREPERFLVEPDLDSGQDVKRLGLRLRALGVREVWFIKWAAADFRRQPGFQGIEVRFPGLVAPSVGWNAVSLAMWKKDWQGDFVHGMTVRPWPEQFPPLERVGKSILLWYFPGPAADSPK